MIYVTGVLEAAGAIGLLVPLLRTAAARGLIALLVALLPANVYAAVTGVAVGGAAATPLWFRTLLQVFWIGVVWQTALSAGSRDASADRQGASRPHTDVPPGVRSR